MSVLAAVVVLCVSGAVFALSADPVMWILSAAVFTGAGMWLAAFAGKPGGEQ